MMRAIPLLPLYASMAWRGTTLPLQKFLEIEVSVEWITLHAV